MSILIRRVVTLALTLVTLTRLAACGPSNNVRLIYNTNTSAVLPLPGAPSVAVVMFNDERTRQYIGERKDGSVFTASSTIADWFSRSLADELGRQGVQVSFASTLEQARAMRGYLDTVHNLRSGEDGLKIILMSELPSNAILARQFIQEFDGFSIGSNDMTQMVLATARDNSSLSPIYDEEDPAVVWAILVTIFSGQKFGKKVGFCGQGVANSEVLRGLVAISGITSASVVPDTYYRTKQDKLLEAAGKADVAKLASDPAKIRAWYDAETARLHGELRDSLGGSRENTARKALKAFRATFHKPVIYAAWNWNETVEDALHQAGFATFEEQAAALAEQRKKLA